MVLVKLDLKHLTQIRVIWVLLLWLFIAMDNGTLTTLRHFCKLSDKVVSGLSECPEVNVIFSTRNMNTVENRPYTARIRPGYILMNESKYLEKNYPTGSFHSKLLRDFTGKDLA